MRTALPFALLLVAWALIVRGRSECEPLALDTETGKFIWQKKADDQPFARIAGTPTLYNGRLYVPIPSQEENAGTNPIYRCCKFRGNLAAIDGKTGAAIWRVYFAGAEAHYSHDLVAPKI